MKMKMSNKIDYIPNCFENILSDGNIQKNESELKTEKCGLNDLNSIGGNAMSIEICDEIQDDSDSNDEEAFNYKDIEYNKYIEQ